MTPTTATAPADLPVTAEAIRAVVVADALEEMARAVAEDDDPAGWSQWIDGLRQGEAAIRVRAYADTCSGRTYSILIAPSVRAADGHWCSAPVDQLIHIAGIRRRDSRISPAENARHKFAARFAGVQVPIEWVNE